MNRDAARAALAPLPADPAYASGRFVIAMARAAGIALPMPPQYDVPFSTVQVLDDERLTVPLRAKKPRAYFVDSMSDLFHEDVPRAAIARVFAVAALSPHHLFMVLTKRPERQRHLLTDPEFVAEVEAEMDVLAGARGWHAPPLVWPLPNWWAGTSAEDQQRADERIPILLDTPAAVRFVSIEPQLGPIEVSWAFDPLWNVDSHLRQTIKNGMLNRDQVDSLRRATLSWCIVGGESGTGARPFDIAWARSILSQCHSASVPFFFKQGGFSNRCAHSAHGSHIDCIPIDLQVREFPR